jgi:predicted transcriptional regulator
MPDGVRTRSAAFAGLLVLLMLSPLVVADPVEEGLELIVEVGASENGLYFTDASNLEVVLRIHNPDSVRHEFTYNPACPYDLVASNADWTLDIDDERICPTQGRSFNVQPGQTRVLSTWSYDWAEAPSGDILLEFSQPQANLEASASIVFHRSSVMPEGLRLQAVLAETIGEQMGHTSEMPAMVLLSISNLGDEVIELPFDEACRVEVADTDSLLITDMSCGEGAILAGQTLTLGWSAWGFTSSINGGQNLQFMLTGIDGASTAVETTFTNTPLGEDTSSLRTSAIVEIDDELTWRFAVTNTDDAPAKLVFENTCTVEMHVLSPSGEIVYDTRGQRDCPSIGSELKIGAQETFTLTSDSWDMLDAEGCELNDGLHLLVLGQPDHGLIASHAFEYSGSGTGDECRIAAQDPTAVRFAVDGLQILDADDVGERMSFQMRIDNFGEEDFALYWPADCTLEISIDNPDAVPTRTWTTDCDGLAGHSMVLSAGANHVWPTIEIPFVEDGTPLAEGTYLVTVRTTSVPSFVAQAAHTYDGLFIAEPTLEPEVIIPEQEEVEEEVVEPATIFTLTGDWHYVTQLNQGCWLLSDDTNGVEHSYIAHMQDGAWRPSPGMSGTYSAEFSEAAGDCGNWQGIVILETIGQNEPAPVISAPTAPAEPVQTPVEGVLEYAPTAAAVIATTSLSLMVLLYIGNTEWIRIPAFQLGFGLLGMVRRSRAHDGEYQRGRIMGYLVANPGVHFRALLGALDMSNGQLTHHLKNLEGGERIWRRKDGRLVRFYPAAIQQSLNDDDLPVPLLTPDPNSLQGKILQLLDATENDIINLSQKELSIRLEASQQLISHHLRTLEKFGLIEREKVGMRYRYQLTREAIFLVNSNDFNVDPD